MKTNSNSRLQFLANSARVLAAGCVLSLCPKSLMAGILSDDEIPDPKKLNYCGYSCPGDCKMLRATRENNIELKKEAHKEWRLEEKYDMAFDADKVYCYGCKSDKPDAGIVVTNCSVRNCAIEKNYDCCIECNELAACEKEIWTTFPDFHKAIIEMQKRYLAG